ncbi:hypothetical protein E2C01_010862 [Portunus trituberculatus]|uniref:Uncharacterized protein n=1 Tax=Portunus trituberculatus TaxID=210409 RepID=A0A5B7D9K4_PORTR|nr:hypothetical protein [Portunus trituberculatus]
MASTSATGGTGGDKDNGGCGKKTKGAEGNGWKNGSTDEESITNACLLIQQIIQVQTKPFRDCLTYIAQGCVAEVLPGLGEVGDVSKPTEALGGEEQLLHEAGDGHIGTKHKAICLQPHRRQFRDVASVDVLTVWPSFVHRWKEVLKCMHDTHPYIFITMPGEQ